METIILCRSGYVSLSVNFAIKTARKTSHQQSRACRDYFWYDRTQEKRSTFMADADGYYGDSEGTSEELDLSFLDETSK